jgi:formyltetrahydrofolate dehydrogenase
MKIRILGDKNTTAYKEAAQLIISKGYTLFDDSEEYLGDDYIDVSIAPLLQEKIDSTTLTEPKYGTLIFHPSPLPYGRGASSIRWAYRRKEPVTAATWFWANDKLDAGDICEQEIVKIDYDISPREFYEQHIIPAMIRTLERALNALSIGLKREIKQIEKYSTYDSRIE